MTRLEIRAVLTMAGALHVTSDLTDRAIDQLTARGANGIPHIPGSSLRGALRQEARAILRGLERPACADATGCDKAQCLLCGLFGDARRPSRIRISDATPLQAVETPTRHSVAMSRHRRASYERLLFAKQVAGGEGTEWAAELDGVFPDVAAAEDAALILEASLRSLTGIGSSRSRGLGQIAHVSATTTILGVPLEDAAREAAAARLMGGHS